MNVKLVHALITAMIVLDHMFARVLKDGIYHVMKKHVLVYVHNIFILFLEKIKMNVLGIMAVVTTTVLTQLEVITVHVTTIAILFTQINTHVCQVKRIIYCF